jgi:hypothetical protein
MGKREILGRGVRLISLFKKLAVHSKAGASFVLKSVPPDVLSRRVDTVQIQQGIYLDIRPDFHDAFFAPICGDHLVLFKLRPFSIGGLRAARCSKELLSSELCFEKTTRYR